MNTPPMVPANRHGEPPGAVRPARPDDPINSPQAVAHDYLAFFRGRVVVATIVLLTALFSLLTLLVLQADLQPTSWDVTVTHEIQEFPYMPVGVVLIAVSQPGFAPWNWVLIGALVVGFLAARRPIEALFIALAGAGGVLAEIVKNLVDRPRPTPSVAHVIGNLTTFSFPSGHTTGYTILFGFLFYLAYAHLRRGNTVRMLLLIFFALMILLVGPSRVYMGQHWASDTIAGYALGFAYLLLLVELYRLWLRRGKKVGVGVAANA